MEVYVDDMIIKSIEPVDHVVHLRETFYVLRENQINLNLEKCTFGV